MNPLSLLLVEDSCDDEYLLLRELRKGGWAVEHRRVDSAEALQSALKEGPWDLVISDFNMPGFSGMEALELCKGHKLDIPFLLVSGTVGEETAVSAMRAGAHDFILKGNYSRLIPAIQRELKEAQGRRARRSAEESLVHTHRILENTHEELRSAHEQLLRQERLKLLGEMAGGVAHDFNNSLASIQGLAETMLMYPEVLNDPIQVEEFLEMIRTAAEDAANVVKRLGEFYRERGAPSLIEPIDLNALVEQTLNLTQAKWKALTRSRGVQVEVVREFCQEATTVGHAAELRQALTNLIFNAVDAMPQGGTLTLRTHTCVEGQVVCLEVQDSGIGMDAETRDHCMDPFFTTKGEHGTGLGLAMVYGILRRHEAMLEVESELGVGTTFRLCFPRSQGSVTTPGVDGAATPIRGRSLKILLAEDDPLLRRVLVKFLRTEGHQVQEVDNGLEAQQNLQSELPDVMILSRSLAGLTGLQLCQQILELYPQLPLILVSGLLKAEVPPGVRQVISKPFSLRVLQQAIHQATAQKTPVVGQ